ncbi:MAG TPA: MauE/DoxX family redox-associated membrane protein [Steroidobacteraceae bacterium]|jgi:hypothetical protein|nr:MauE/DoxX family redox-associated membrane protein [Steroidobacteraceae bacterium]
MTDPVSLPGIVQSLSVQLAAFQALLLVASGLHKLIRRARIQAVMHEFAGVPPELARFSVVLVAAAEVLAAWLLWSPSYRAAGAALATLIWSGYFFLMLRAIAQGRRDVDCGCSFGAAAQRPLGAYHVMRNAVLILTAALVAAGSPAGIAGPVLTSQILAAIALLALYGALDQAMALTPPRAGELL